MSAVTLLFFMGLLMLVLGGDSFVCYASALAGKLRIPPLIIGATVVSAGTALPEIVVTVSAALSGCGDIAAGNAFGSTVCTACLAGGLGILALPTTGIRRRDMVKRLCFFLLGACFTALSATKTGGFGVGLGIILLSLFAIYTFTSGKDGRTAESSCGGERPEMICVGLLVSAAALYLGSGLLIDNGILLAEVLGVPQRVMAVTFISLGTSLPELTTVISSLRRRQGSIGLGVAVGSGILNLLLALGLPAVIAPIAAPREIYRDLAAASAAMCVLILPSAVSGKTYRWQGGVLLGMYLAYIALNFI